MDTYRCIAIGINRYQFLQPLNYAEADAQALHQFLRDEGNLSPKQSLLLSDTSAWVDKQSTYPNRDNILNWLGIEETQKDEGETNSEFPTPFAEQVAWRHSEFPTLWFYFSGYGVNYQGDDYLMPIDGQLEDIPNTGIAIRSLLQALQAQNAHKILVILDINRSLMEETTVGQQTIALGKKMGIAVILSAQTDECSYEATSLGHGLFTAALLEALRYYHCHLTLAKLDRYLRDRLPELSTHYWRPIQTPAIVSPSLEASYQPLLPSPQTTRLKWEGFLPRTEKEVSCTTVQSASQGTAIREKTLDQKNSEFRIPNSELRIQVPDFSRGDQENKASLFQVPGFIREANPKSIDKQVLSSQSKSSVSVFPKILRSKWFWIGGGVTLLLASIMTQLLDLGISFDAFNPSKADVEQAVLSRSKIYLQSHQASRFNQAIGVARKVDAQTDIARWSQVILDIAQGRAKAGDFVGAIAAAQLVPSDQHSLYRLSQQEIERWKILTKQQQKNQVLMEAAKSLIQSTQASSYNRAITTLRQVPVGEPGYLAAQQLIRQWSQQIYLMANARAAKGNFRQAVETATLIPQDTPAYKIAKNKIAKWQQELETR